MDDVTQLAEKMCAEGKRDACEYRWQEAARSYRIAADFFTEVGSHSRAGDALREAARAYEGLQSWRTAGDAWLAAGRAFAAAKERGEIDRADDIGEAHLWAGYTFFWANQHYDSLRAHLTAGDAFEVAGNLASAERAYRYAGMSKALAFGTLGEVARGVHPSFADVIHRNPLTDLKRIAERRQTEEGARSVAARSHVDALFNVRRSLETAGNHDESREVYVLERDAELRDAFQRKKMGRLSWLLFYKWALGYGEGLGNLLALSTVIFLLVFPLMFRLLPELEGAHGWADYVHFSLACLTTLEIDGMTARSVVGWLANLEFLGGLVVFGLLVSVLVRLVSR